MGFWRKRDFSYERNTCHPLTLFHFFFTCRLVKLKSLNLKTPIYGLALTEDEQYLLLGLKDGKLLLMTVRVRLGAPVALINFSLTP
jgi:hypothetical protein